EKLNIIVIGATHERYESLLAKTGHNFYSIKMGKLWNKEYGNKPKNYYELDSLPFNVPYNLVLCHTSCDRLDAAMQLGAQLGIPVVRHCHTLPESEYENGAFHRYR